MVGVSIEDLLMGTETDLIIDNELRIMIVYHKNNRDFTYNIKWRLTRKEHCRKNLQCSFLLPFLLIL